VVTTVPPHPLRKRLTLIGYAAFILDGWNIVLIPSLIRSIGNDFKQSDAAFGLFFLLSSLVYAFGSWSSGALTERVGRRIVLPLSVLALALGFIAEAAAPTWTLLLAASLLVSWGGGGIDGGMNSLFLELYRDARGGALSLLHVFFSIGGLVAPFVIGQLLSAGLAWRLIMLGTAVVALPLVAFLAVTPMPLGLREVDSKSVSTATARPGVASRVPFVALAAAIALYVGSELAVSNWLVKYQAGVPIATATAVLSLFWAGLTVGRLLSSWLAERVDYFAFTISCAGLAGLTLFLAVLTGPGLLPAAALFALTGVLFGPIYPMIIALGGNIYPNRLAAVGGTLSAAAVAGGTIYPPLMGLLASTIGLRAGMIGAALLGIPQVLALLVARLTAGQATSDEAKRPVQQPSATRIRRRR
jgi:fucose permease